LLSDIQTRGEWHTYPEKNLLPETVKRKVATWYLNAFQITKLKVRDPADVTGGSIGFHNDSFGYSTVSSCVLFAPFLCRIELHSAKRQQFVLTSFDRSHSN
jgi:hypothetical protein